MDRRIPASPEPAAPSPIDGAPTGANPDFERQLEAALNPAQLAAATAPDGPHLVIAGAGSGKTRTLVHRVAYLVERGVAPESILLLTFTRRASKEMLARATELLDERCRRVAGGTFHSFAHRTLRHHAAALGYSERFTILDRGDATDFLALLRAEAGFDRRDRRFPQAKTLVNLFSKQVNTQRTLRDLLETELPQFLPEHDALADLRGRWVRRKKEQNVVDYDDLLVLLRDLLKDHPDIRQRLSRRYRHILVDEYQDTNRLQAHITALLASSHRNLMVVGDDAQSIYRFRGAAVRNILDFAKIFPGAVTTTLEQNYRSSQPILDLGNAVIAQAKEGYSKQLFTREPGEAKPRLVRVPDDFAQAEYVARQVLELRERGVALGQMAVLSRAAWHSNALELELQQRNIPFKKFGGIRFVEAAHVKDVVALLRLSQNPFDTSAWFRVLQLFEGVGPKTAQSLIAHVLERGGDPRVLVQPKLTSRRYGGDLRTLSELLVEISGEETALSTGGRLDRALAVYKPWMARQYDDHRRREKDFDSLVVLAERYPTVDAFLADLAIDPPEFGRGGSPSDPEDEHLTLSTIHSAKGLEWKAVFVLQMNAGRFPSWNSADDEDDYEEERRLLYVAVTRAQSDLFLLKPEEISTRGHGFDIGELSPLLEEIPDLAERVDEVRWVPPLEGVDPATGENGGPDDLDQLLRIQDYFQDG